MSVNLDRMSQKKEAFALARVQGLTVDKAAAQAHVSARTAQRYSVDPAVTSRIRDLQSEALGETARRLQQGAGAMLDVLKGIAESKSESSTARLRAALGWLDLVFRATEVLDLSVRLAELEERIAANG
jgi:hypothetical protein